MCGSRLSRLDIYIIQADDVRIAMLKKIQINVTWTVIYKKALKGFNY